LPCVKKIEDFDDDPPGTHYRDGDGGIEGNYSGNSPMKQFTGQAISQRKEEASLRQAQGEGTRQRF
jgi:hypothetical protein